MNALTNFCNNRLQERVNVGQNQKGFTLIEIMVVVAIVGILASIAIPSYTDYVKKGKAAEATANLADLHVKMEQYYQDNRTYLGGNCAPANGAKYFDYTCSVGPTASAYTLQAAGKAGESMGGFNYTVDQNNAKTSSYDGSATVNCWISSKSGAC
jgi:type IV pilus assembly protein PilE